MGLEVVFFAFNRLMRLVSKNDRSALAIIERISADRAEWLIVLFDPTQNFEAAAGFFSISFNSPTDQVSADDHNPVWRLFL